MKPIVEVIKLKQNDNKLHYRFYEDGVLIGGYPNRDSELSDKEIVELVKKFQEIRKL